MKYIFSLLVLVSLLPVCRAQEDKSFAGYFEVDCLKYTLHKLVEKDTSVTGALPAELLKPKVKTIYIKNADYLKNMPDTMGGYTFKYVNPEEWAAEIWRAMKNGEATLLYISNAFNNNSRHTVWVTPMYIEKTGRKYTPQYSERGRKVMFLINYGTGMFNYERSEPY